MSKYIVTFNDPRKVGCVVTRTFGDMPLTSILEGFWVDEKFNYLPKLDDLKYFIMSHHIISIEKVKD